MPLLKKAQSFLGVLTLQQGCMAISALQLAMAFASYKLIGYFRPSLATPVGIPIAAIFAITALIGLYASYYRNLSVFRVFFGFFIVGFGLMVLLNLYLLDALPFIPMPAADVLPFSTEGHAHMGIIPAITGGAQTKAHFLQHDTMQHKAAIALVGLSRYLHSLPAVVNGQSIPTDLLAVHNLNVPAHDAPGHKHAPAEKPAADKPAAAAKPAAEKHAEKTVAAPTTEPKVHIADEEEVSEDEIPREFDHLPVEEEYEVTAITKIMKHSMRFAAGGALAVVVLIHIYFLWIIGTFWLNGCTAIDEGGLADQFEPTLDAHDA